MTTKQKKQDHLSQPSLIFSSWSQSEWGTFQVLPSWVGSRDSIHNTSFSSQLVNGPNKLEQFQPSVMLSCMIFDSFGNPTLSDQSFCSTHPSPTLTTWSHKSRPLSWLPPLLCFRIRYTWIGLFVDVYIKVSFGAKMYLHVLQISRVQKNQAFV